MIHPPYFYPFTLTKIITVAAILNSLKTMATPVLSPTTKRSRGARSARPRSEVLMGPHLMRPTPSAEPMDKEGEDKFILEQARISSYWNNLAVTVQARYRDYCNPCLRLFLDKQSLFCFLS